MSARFKPVLRGSVTKGSLAVCLLLSACAVKSRLLSEPLPGQKPDLGWTTSAAAGLTLEVDQLITRNSGGSWVRDASWDEYVVTVKNNSRLPVEIEGLRLYSGHFPGAVESSTSRQKLEAQTNTTLRTMKDVGIVAGSGAIPAGVVAATVGSGGILGASGATAAVAAAGIVAIPVAMVGSTIYVIKRRHRARDDNVLIGQALVERGLGVPQQIAAGMQVRKSAFFPVTPAPTRLVAQYETGGEAQELVLDLPALSGLHLNRPLTSAR